MGKKVVLMYKDNKNILYLKVTDMSYGILKVCN